MKALSLLLIAVLGACDSDDRTYTLYRNSPAFQAMRIHFASFNANERSAYNQENCEIVARHMNASLGSTPAVRYWCEKGRFRE